MLEQAKKFLSKLTTEPAHVQASSISLQNELEYWEHQSGKISLTARISPEKQDKLNEQAKFLKAEYNAEVTQAKQKHDNTRNLAQALFNDTMAKADSERNNALTTAKNIYRRSLRAAFIEASAPLSEEELAVQSTPIGEVVRAQAEVKT